MMMTFPAQAHKTRSQTSIEPHGGTLIDRHLKGDVRAAMLEEAKLLPAIRLNRREAADVELIANGGFSPLKGFMTNAEYHAVVTSMHLPNGLPWTIPVVLSASDDEADRATQSGRAKLVDENGAILGVIQVHDAWRPDKETEATHVLKATDRNHPGVLYLEDETGPWYLGGPIWALDNPAHSDIFAPYWVTPSEMRLRFAEKGWRQVVAFQTRNPLHRAHEYLTKNALELVDGLLIHPIGEVTKADDVPADVRLRCYEVLIEKYYPSDRVMLGFNPAAMRYAGPREAIFHALVRKNYGCSHFIVGRDHAGVGQYYGTYDAQTIFREFDASSLGIRPMFFEHAFFCTKSQSMASVKTAPVGGERIFLSGTKVREMLRRGELPPPEFTRPEVAQILLDAYRQI